MRVSDQVGSIDPSIQGPIVGLTIVGPDQYRREWTSGLETQDSTELPVSEELGDKSLSSFGKRQGPYEAETEPMTVIEIREPSICSPIPTVLGKIADAGGRRDQ